MRIAAAVDGDDEARAWLAHRWAGPLYRFAYRMLGNEADAHDAAQEALVKVLKNLHRYDPERSFQTWAFGIARNTCLDEFRRRKRRRSEPLAEFADPSGGPLTLVSRAQRARQLMAALDRLPPMYREVLVLYHFEQLKYSEIATALDLPLGTVMNRIFRARARLREAYLAAGGDSGAGGDP